MITAEPTFFFYDYETFGASPSLDRPCQFAGVRTDQDFNIIEEPVVLYCKPLDDYLPQPEACLITGITPEIAAQKGVSEPEFIQVVHREFSRANTCILGYNNIRFDDEVTRYTLYRNFFDPYAWAWKNNNSRWDLLDVMRAAYALRPDGIQWPLNEQGTTSFKLEHLSVANGIEHSQAHDAMADVIATIELAKQLKQAQPKLFNYLLNHRHKRSLENLIDIPTMKPLVHVSGMFGVEQHNLSVIAPVAWHPENTNAVIVVDLNKDLSPLFDLNAEQLRERLYTKRIDLAEHELPAPLKLVHLNKCPVLADEKVLRSEDLKRLNIDKNYYQQNLNQLRSYPELREKLIAVFSSPDDFKHNNNNVDTALYSGFFSNADRTTMEIIRQTAPEKLGETEFKIEDPRISPLLFRYRARHYPETLNEQERQKWQIHKRDYFEAQLPAYIQRIENLYLEHQQDSKKVNILNSVARFVEKIID